MIIEKSRTPSNDTESDGTDTPPSPRHSPPTPNQVTQTLLSDTTQQVNLVHQSTENLSKALAPAARQATQILLRYALMAEQPNSIPPIKRPIILPLLLNHEVLPISHLPEQ
ncbi:hypothetical protein Pmani_014528 [Petrolisthes manimaculis]|uniref:Uncharacterized protein n=1 Tax=Petrolisthes manimaculis TaxID=1843537 RepID=A0AAE1UCK1_9EUCA|nr:hypothetical protein Pmani_014528 [Petrolisthes manimaculis]